MKVLTGLLEALKGRPGCSDSRCKAREKHPSACRLYVAILFTRCELTTTRIWCWGALLFHVLGEQIASQKAMLQRFDLMELKDKLPDDLPL